MRRRTLLKHGATATVVGLAGCIGGDEGGQNTTTEATRTETPMQETTEETTETTTEKSLSGTLKVATYSSFIDAPSTAPGGWLKKAFEKRHPDVTVKYQTPENGLNYFIQRRAQGVLFTMAESVNARAGESASLGGALIEVRGYGEMTPVGCNTSFAGRVANRRVEVWVR